MQSGRLLRDVAMFLMGAAGFFHELLTMGPERPTILLACLALMGFPIFLRRDEKEAPPPPAVPPGDERRIGTSPASQERDR